ncbi:peptidylprolyl isomerase [Candidatus Saccharibacteria bacterium]|nr:peptidylprolyl isomerase [Candidatus Saccharibacteria bacterium]MBI3337792.1 peptidylprolyl isomerase [Candidatus Saccharibacteria bacterium]
MKHKLSHIVRRKKVQSAVKSDASQQELAPRITNETIATHREEVIGSARKYIYRGRHTKHQIVVISTTLFITTLVLLFSYCTLALYRFQSSSAFLYHVTQVFPFPIARAGSNFVAYENYLFELRHYTHYYEVQQKLDFNNESGKQQLAEFRKRALDKVINDAYVKQLASKYKVSVSNKEINYQIDIVRDQNRLGSSDKVFEDVLKDYWGWSVDDFKRSLRQQLLAQKVVAVLDTTTRTKAETALNELKSGVDFVAVAKKYSDDEATKANGGDLGFLIDKTNHDLPAQTTGALFKLQPGQYSDIVNIGYALVIVKNNEFSGDKVRGSHILFTFKDINSYINDLKDKQKARTYISVN